VVLSARTRGSGHKLKHRRFPLNIKKHFYCEGGQALAEVAQRSCGISILGGVQKAPGHGPGQPAVGDPA